MRDTSHKILVRNNKYHRTECYSSYSVKDTSARHWMLNRCPGKPEISTVTRPIQINESVHIGKQNSHHTHDLYIYFIYRGLVFCCKCGAHGVQHFNLLAKQCEEPKEAWLRTLKFIEDDRLPHNVAVWPNMLD